MKSLPCVVCLSLTHANAVGAHQSGSAPLIRSPARSSHSKAAAEGSKTKKSRSSSTSKSVRFSLGAAPTPEDKQAAAAVATPNSGAAMQAAALAAAPEPEADVERVQSTSPQKSQLAGEGTTRKTRSGKPLGRLTGPTDTEQTAHGSMGTQEVVLDTGRSRKTRSGCTFSAQTEPSTRSESASVLSKRNHKEGSTPAASVETAGTSSSSPAPEPSLSQAAALPASHHDSVCHPWKSSLLGIGLSLPEKDRLSNRGRPPTTDHPCHKKKSASMTRR